MKRLLSIVVLIGGFALNGNSQEIFVLHPESNQQKSIPINNYVLFEYEFIDSNKLSKWGMVTGKILDVKDEQFLLERRDQQAWFEIKQLWAIKRLSRGAYRRATRTANSYGPEAGGGPLITSTAEAVGMIGVSMLWSAAVASIDLIQHAPNFRFSQSKGWEFRGEE